MCYNVEQRKKVSDLVDRYQLVLGQENFTAKDRITISEPMATVVERPEGRALEIKAFGFLPWFATDPKRMSANAKSETVRTNGMFRQAFEQRRCIVPSTRFFEWLGTEKGNKRLFPISLLDQEIFSLAGIYDSWKDPATGDKRHTVAILTTAANSDMQPYHTREPVILPTADDEDLWLHPSTPLADLIPLMLPLSPGLLIPRPEMAFKPVKPGQGVDEGLFA